MISRFLGRAHRVAATFAPLAGALVIVIVNGKRWA